MVICLILFVFLLGIGVGLSLKENEIKKEIKLRKNWEKVAYNLMARCWNW